jgi:hypothetical protein
MSDEPLYLWTIYNDPERPSLYVVRRFTVDHRGARPDGAPSYVGDSLDEARRSIPGGLHKLLASEDDNPDVVETWL